VAQGTQIEPAVPYNEGGSRYVDYAPESPDFYLDLTAQLVAENGL
jgi:hypothetical protein